MNRLFWTLPGPEAFLRTIERDVLAGVNVVVALPYHYPEGLRMALAGRVHENGTHRWRMVNLNASNEGLAPLDILWSLSSARERPRNLCLQDLARNQDFLGQVIWIDGMTPVRWLRWKAFLHEYEHVCRSVKESQRTVLCVGLLGDMRAHSIEETALVTHSWSGVVSSLDMFLYSSLVWRDADLPRLLVELVSVMSAELAGYDPVVVDMFRRTGFKSVFEPNDVLRQIAKSRGWGLDLGDELRDWQRGASNWVDRKKFEHSAAALIRDRHAEIARRMWRAQVKVLYPYIEERRVSFIQEYDSFLVVPHKFQSGVVEDKQDLEIGQIYSLLVKNVGVPAGVTESVSSLRNLRNKLSHLEIATVDMIEAIAEGDYFLL